MLGHRLILGTGGAPGSHSKGFWSIISLPVLQHQSWAHTQGYFSVQTGWKFWSTRLPAQASEQHCPLLLPPPRLVLSAFLLRKPVKLTITSSGGDQQHTYQRTGSRFTQVILPEVSETDPVINSNLPGRPTACYTHTVLH